MSMTNDERRRGRSYSKVHIAMNTCMTRKDYYENRGAENGMPVNWRPQHSRAQPSEGKI